MEPHVLIKKHGDKKARSATRRVFKKKCSCKDDAKEFAAMDKDGRKVVGGGSTFKGEESAAYQSALEGGGVGIKGDTGPSRKNSKTPTK